MNTAAPLVDEEYNGYTFVDLGLSVKWATANIGQSSDHPAGYYFMWGATQGYGADRKPITDSTGKVVAINFNWLNYKYSDSTGANMLKYNTDKSYGTVDSLTTLLPEDDAACALIGKKCRMPTKDEVEELFDACDFEFKTNYNGITGLNVFLFILKSDSSKVLVFPLSGLISGSALNASDTNSHFWTKDLANGDPLSAEGVCLYNQKLGADCNVEDYYRYNGMPIRAVLPKE